MKVSVGERVGVANDAVNVYAGSGDALGWRVDQGGRGANVSEAGPEPWQEDSAKASVTISVS